MFALVRIFMHPFPVCRKPHSISKLRGPRKRKSGQQKKIFPEIGQGYGYMSQDTRRAAEDRGGPYLSSKILMGFWQRKCIIMHFPMRFPKVPRQAAQKQNREPTCGPLNAKPFPPCSLLLCFVWNVLDEIAGLTFQRRANLVYHVNGKMFRRACADCGNGGLSDPRDF